MTTRTMRAGSLALTILLLLTLFVFAPQKAAAIENGVVISDVGSGTYRISDTGGVTMSFSVYNGTTGSITVRDFTTAALNVLMTITPISPTVIAAGETHTFTITGTASTDRFGSFDEYIMMTYDGSSAGSLGIYVELYFNAFNPTPSPVSSLPKVGISKVDRNGNTVNAATGDAGERVTVKVPLVCLEGPISSIAIAPVLSADLAAFPFVIEDIDYTLKYNGNIGKDNIVEFNYDFKFSDKATSGAKKVEFNVMYTNKDLARETVTLAVFVNVVNGFVEPVNSPDINAAAPKLIVDSYSLDPEKVYAGESFDVTLGFRNTSNIEDVENVQITIDNELGKVLPANGSSNTVFIDKIKMGETYTCVMKFQSAPDTEAKAYIMGMKLSFAGSKSKTEFSSAESFTVPIQQKIRIKTDEPVVYDDAWQNQSCAMMVALYNMGKAPIYNCMIDIEGEGLSMEETYFGGTVNSGSTMRADFSIMPSVAGDIAATVIITYEDVYGEQMEERLSVSIYVNEEYVPTDDVFDPTLDPDYVDPSAAPAIPTWVWFAGGGVIVVVVVIILLSAKKRRRARELEDV